MIDPKLEALIRSATDAVILLNSLADDAEAEDDLQRAHDIRHRAQALDDASTGVLIHVVESMTDGELNADLIAQGLDPAEVDAGLDDEESPF